ncbi:MAG: ATP-binding protein, partial [Erythrobacter sp.]
EVSEQDRDTRAKRTEIRQLDDRYFELSYHPTRTGGFVVTRTDVTERHLAENLAEERDQLLSRILEANPIPVVMAEAESGHVVYRSPAAIQMIGDTKSAHETFIDPNARGEYVALIRKHRKVEDFRTPFRAADGSTISVSLSGVLIEFGGKECVVSSMTDLTEVLEREALIRRVVEACPAPVLMNRAATGEQLYRSPKVLELLGDKDFAADYWLNPEDRAPYIEEVRRTGEVTEWPGTFVNAKGVPFQGAVSAQVIEWEGEDVVVSHIRDMTDQLAMESELELQRQQGFQNEKMMALGGLMAGVAHELNNPLSVVVGHAMMLQDEVQDPNVLRKTQKISKAAERCAKIVKAFLTMARHEPARMEKTDVNELIETAVEVASYGSALGPAKIEVSLASDAKQICSDPDQLTQVIINLVLNATQAIGDSSGTVRVSSKVTQEGMQIIVEDDGPGVPEDIRGRIFEPFFTTKGVGQGTGIGLAMCHRIVSAHNGRILVSSSPNGGAHFTVELPCNEKRAVEDVEETSRETKEKICRVLVIDDEPDVADMNAEILTRGGFLAEVVYSAHSAFEKLESANYDAILSDLNMPDIDGRGVYETIAERRPDLAKRTGFLTGDTMGKRSQAFLGESNRPYIEKPVSPKELRAFVSRLISGNAA